MSLGIVVKAPEGLVLAADSRVTVTAKSPEVQALTVNFDNANKILNFNEPSDKDSHSFVGVVTYGLATIGSRTAFSFLPELQSKLSSKGRLTVEEYAELLSNFYLDQWRKVMPEDYEGPNITFVVSGFNVDDPYGRVYVFDIPQKPKAGERNPGMNSFGITWGGAGRLCA